MTAHPQQRCRRRLERGGRDQRDAGAVHLPHGLAAQLAHGLEHVVHTIETDRRRRPGVRIHPRAIVSARQRSVLHRERDERGRLRVQARDVDGVGTEVRLVEHAPGGGLHDAGLAAR